MIKNDIPKIRLFNQQITATKFTKPAEIVAWCGAMQAQDYPMAKWAIGLRLPGATEEQIEQAIVGGRIIRTHLMRPTWHFVAAEDVRWLLALTAPQIRSTSGAMLRQLELDRKTFDRSNETIAKALQGGNHLTRAELMLELERTGIKTDDFGSTYLMFSAELGALVCNGIKRGKKQTYALLDERVPPTAILSREEAIGELTKRYFTSHAPATLKDFIWWSGLRAADARKGLEMNRSMLVSEEIDGQTYYLPDSLIKPQDDPASLHLLPAFDEFMVSYKDRTAALDAHLTKEAITGNGIFKPVVVVNGKIAGIWRRSYKKDSITVEKTLFGELSDFDHEAFHSKARAYGDYEGKSVQIR